MEQLSFFRKRSRVKLPPQFLEYQADSIDGQMSDRLLKRIVETTPW